MGKTIIQSETNLGKMKFNLIEPDGKLLIKVSSFKASTNVWVNKDQAIKIIEHLKKQFGL